ncbi:MAG: homoserine kinase [Proteobacteria bacterium]|nr:homoserine kinase [Pseudomonadota bacterium]
MAVYTEVSGEDIAAFLAQYDVGALVSLKGIAEGVENSNYLLLTDRSPYIVTLYEKRVAAEDLPYFLGLMEHLAGRGVPCPTPIHGRDGKALRELCGRPAVIVSFLEGVWPRRIQPEHCAALGEALARLHIAGADFGMSRPNALSFAGWRQLYAACKARADTVQGGLCAILEAELDHLEGAWPSDLPAGIIHADLFPDNVFFEGFRITGLIDFYFSCNDFFAYDVAVCLNAWCFERYGEFNITKASQMLSSYRGVREFSAAELEALPRLARGAALRFLLTRLYDLLHQVEGALGKPKDPLEHLRKLRFHQGVSGPAAYGLT